MNKFYYDKLVNSLSENGFDAILIGPSEELRFIVDESPYLCERFQGLFVKSDGTCFYVCNLLTAGEMQKTLGKEIKVYSWFDCDNFIDITRKALEDYNLIGKKIAVNSSIRAYEIIQIMNKVDIEFLDGRPLLEEIRIYKTEEELENLRIAAKIADNAFMKIIEFVKPGMTESEVSNKMSSLMMIESVSDAGCLVAAGKNSSYPHYIKNNGVVKRKDVVLLDFGCTYKGMKSDSSRTIFVGEVTDKQKEVYYIVREALERAENKACEGSYIPDVDLAARDFIALKGYGEKFTTRLGHGIGYMGHEAPDIKYNNKRHLEKGMAFSLEPGIYLDGEFGIRIEDIIIISNNGTEILNKSPKDLIVI